MESIECFKCQRTDVDLSFVPIAGTNFGIYLCPGCNTDAGRSPAVDDF